MTDVIGQKKLSFDDSLWIKIIEGKYAENEKKRLETLQDIAEKLRNRFTDNDFSSLYIVGSILKTGEFYDFSDIDIAVDGLRKDYFQVWAEIEEVTGRKIDLIEMEKCRFKESIKKYGLKII